MCIFNELPAVGLFLAFDSTSMRTDHFTNGKKYRKLVNNAVFVHNKSLFFVSAAAMNAFQLEEVAVATQHIPRGLSTTDY